MANYTNLEISCSKFEIQNPTANELLNQLGKANFSTLAAKSSYRRSLYENEKKIEADKLTVIDLGDKAEGVFHPDGGTFLDDINFNPFLAENCVNYDYGPHCYTT